MVQGSSLRRYDCGNATTKASPPPAASSSALGAGGYTGVENLPMSLFGFLTLAGLRSLKGMAEMGLAYKTVAQGGVVTRTWDRRI